MADGNGQLVKYQDKVNNVRDLFKRGESQIKLALPKHMTVERQLRIVMTTVQRVPALLDCNPQSLIAAVMQCSQLGLEPDGALGHAYLIPFGQQAQLIIGYRGMIDLARRSGQLSTIYARAVYDRDKFVYALGDEEKITHVRCDDGERGEMTHVYAVAKLKDGGKQMEVMSKADVDAIRKRSRAGQSGPWKTDYEEMAKKTVIRRLFKMLPVSVEIQRAVGLDERVDAGLDQDLGDVVELPPAETEDEPAKDAAGLARSRAKGKTLTAGNPPAACDRKHDAGDCGAADCYERTT